VVARAAAGRATNRQVIAANVDTVFIITTATEDLSPRRLDRYLTMVWNAGAAPVVIVNKVDLVTAPATDVAEPANDTTTTTGPSAASSEGAGAREEIVSRLKARLSLVDVVATSALHDTTLDALAMYLQPARTIALVGSSGVGKSTLVNRLLGQAMQRVGPVRDSDQTGRHVTTSRQLIELSGGALLIDTPGMRELEPWAEDGALDAAFADIVSLAEACRFSDCEHESEPGCAVLEAVSSGALESDRLASYRHLLRETAFEDRKRDKAAAADEKRRWKRITQEQKARYRTRERQR
jgi:ribosome biogenesis GTPase